MSIRVILVDDHRVLLEALSALLEQEDGIHVAGTADNAVEALALAASAAPDVVVMDIGMPGMNGAEATRRLIAAATRVKVIALSAYSDKRFVLEMLDAGATGYVVKSAAVSELSRAIHAVVLGQTFLCSEVSGAIAEAARRKGAASVQARLGPREREVLRLLAEGRTSPQIARELNIATSTVDVHRRNIMGKLDLHSIAELTKYAIREGLTSS